MLSKEARKAYEEWKSTGTLTKDPDLVVELHDTFQNIAEHTAGIPQYELTWKDAVYEMNKLHSIIMARDLNCSWYV